MRTATDETEPGLGGTGRRVATEPAVTDPGPTGAVPARAAQTDTSDAEVQRSEGPGRLRRTFHSLTHRSGVIGRLARAGTTSVGATILSHGSYVALLAAAHAHATVASAIAFVVGACFNYFVGRRFTWGRKKRPNPIRETLPYLVVIGCSGLLSISVATLTDYLLSPHGVTNAHRTLILEAANIGSYGLVFFVKFTLLDRLVFRSRSGRQG